MVPPDETSQLRRLLILQDDRPGHYNQSEGIALALSRRIPVEVVRLTVRPRHVLPLRVLRFLFGHGYVGPKAILRLAYRGMPPEPGPADIIVSAGGETALANSALSQMLKCRGIFSGSLRGLPPRYFAAVLTPYRRMKTADRHICYLKPSPVDPDMGQADARIGRNGRTEATLLVGGPSGTHKYAVPEWDALIDAVESITAQKGWRWTLVTSRRTPAIVADRLRRLAEAAPRSFDLVDYRTCGPGTAFAACVRADVILVSEDSNSMITEAVVSRRPVIAFKPAWRRMSADEEGYLADLSASGWLRSVPVTALSTDAVDRLLAEMTPMQVNHLDELGKLLVAKLAL